VSLSRWLGSLAKDAVLYLCAAVAALCIALAGLGFLAASLFVWLASHTGNAAAAAIIGATLMALAALTLLASGISLRKPRRHPLADWIDTIAVVSTLVRQDPKYAVLAALIAGAVTEYFATERKR
jgi:hypothetical protein